MINDILHAVLGGCCCRGYWRCFTIIFTGNSFSPRSIHIQVRPADFFKWCPVAQKPLQT